MRRTVTVYHCETPSHPCAGSISIISPAAIYAIHCIRWKQLEAAQPHTAHRLAPTHPTLLNSFTQVRSTSAKDSSRGAEGSNKVLGRLQLVLATRKFFYGPRCAVLEPRDSLQLYTRAGESTSPPTWITPEPEYGLFSCGCGAAHAAYYLFPTHRPISKPCPESTFCCRTTPFTFSFFIKGRRTIFLINRQRFKQPYAVLEYIATP